MHHHSLDFVQFGTAEGSPGIFCERHLRTAVLLLLELRLQTRPQPKSILYYTILYYTILYYLNYDNNNNYYYI